MARRYPGLSLLRSPGGRVAPFAPLIEGPVALEDVQFHHAPAPFRCSDQTRARQADELARQRAKTPSFVDETKVRVVSMTRAGQGVSVGVQPVPYSLGLATNFAVAKDEATRQQLVPDARSLRISPSSACSNHLGMSALVVTSDGYILLPKSSGHVAVSPNELVPSVSGSADWPAEGAKGMSLEQQLLREFVEEMDLGLHPAQSGLSMAEAIRRSRESSVKEVRLLGLAGNVERGNKPEAFAVIFSSQPRSYFQAGVNGFEHAQKSARTLVSPLTSTGALAKPERAAEGLRQLRQLVEEPDLNGVLRANLLLFLSHIDARLTVDDRRAPRPDVARCRAERRPRPM